ncbi:MAG: glycosyl transferase [Rhodobacterales bacterium]|nr:MAG: glycosyl transferase [Rhodobacterales bacterium]
MVNEKVDKMGPAPPVNVSVIMPLFNAGRTLAASVASVRAQSHPGWELLLIDDASQDDSLALAQRLAAQDPRIRLLQMPGRSGAAAARNLGLQTARGRFIGFLDADDLWHPAKLERQLDFHLHSGAALSFTGYARVSDPEGALITRMPGLDRVGYRRLLCNNPIGCLTVLYDTAICGKMPMPLFKRQHDYALWLQIVRTFGPARGLNQDLAIYRVGRGSLSANKAAAALDIWRILRGQEGLSLPQAARYFSHYAWHGLRHRLIQRPKAGAPVLLSAGSQPFEANLHRK